MGDTDGIIVDNRAGVRNGRPSFTLRNRLRRALWIVTWRLLASWTPPPLWRWRNLLLRLFGADMHPHARVYSSARIWYPPLLTMRAGALLGPRTNCYNMARISIAERAIVSQGAHLCAGTHDIDDPGFQLIAKPIHVGADAWVAAEAFVGPGVTVGEGAVLGARAVAFRDLAPWSVHVGNPAGEKRRRLRPPQAERNVPTGT